MVSKHGVGSVFPGTDGISRLTAVLDRWFSHEYEENNKNVHKDDFKIKEWRLEQRLGVSHFRAPPDYRKFEFFLQGQKNLDLKIPFLRFPTWHRCMKCKMLSSLQEVYILEILVPVKENIKTKNAMEPCASSFCHVLSIWSYRRFSME